MNNYIRKTGYFALKQDGSIEGYAEEDIGEQRPEDLFASCKAWWKIDTADRLLMLQTLVEIYHKGVLPNIFAYYIKAWDIKDSDAYEFGKRAKIGILLTNKSYRASMYVQPKDKTYYAYGITPFRAICNLWIMLHTKTESHGQKR